MLCSCSINRLAWFRANDANIGGKAIQKGLSGQGKMDAALPSPTDQPLPCFFTGLRRHVEGSLVLAFGEGMFLFIATPLAPRYLLTIMRQTFSRAAAQLLAYCQHGWHTQPREILLMPCRPPLEVRSAAFRHRQRV